MTSPSMIFLLMVLSISPLGSSSSDARGSGEIEKWVPLASGPSVLADAYDIGQVLQAAQRQLLSALADPGAGSGDKPRPEWIVAVQAEAMAATLVCGTGPRELAGGGAWGSRFHVAQLGSASGLGFSGRSLAAVDLALAPVVDFQPYAGLPDGDQALKKLVDERAASWRARAQAALDGLPGAAASSMDPEGWSEVWSREGGAPLRAVLERPIARIRQALDRNDLETAQQVADESWDPIRRLARREQKPMDWLAERVGAYRAAFAADGAATSGASTATVESAPADASAVTPLDADARLRRAAATARALYARLVPASGFVALPDTADAEERAIYQLRASMVMPLGQTDMLMAGASELRAQRELADQYQALGQPELAKRFREKADLDIGALAAQLERLLDPFRHPRFILYRGDSLEPQKRTIDELIRASGDGPYSLSWLLETQISTLATAIAQTSVTLKHLPAQGSSRAQQGRLERDLQAYERMHGIARTFLDATGDNDREHLRGLLLADWERIVGIRSAEVEALCSDVESGASNPAAAEPTAPPNASELQRSLRETRDRLRSAAAELEALIGTRKHPRLGPVTIDGRPGSPSDLEWALALRQDLWKLALGTAKGLDSALDEFARNEEAAQRYDAQGDHQRADVLRAEGLADLTEAQRRLGADPGRALGPFVVGQGLEFMQAGADRRPLTLDEVLTNHRAQLESDWERRRREAGDAIVELKRKRDKEAARGGRRGLGAAAPDFDGEIARKEWFRRDAQTVLELLRHDDIDGVREVLMRRWRVIVPETGR